jgi:hypothetical protein
MSAKRFILSDVSTSEAIVFLMDNNAREFRRSFHMDDHKYVLMSLSLLKLRSHAETVTGIVNKILDAIHKLGNVF